MTNIIQPQIAKLTCTKFGNCSIQMKVLLGSYDNQNIIESRYNKLEDSIIQSTLSNVENTILIESQKKNKRALFTIYQGFDEPNFEKKSRKLKQQKGHWRSCKFSCFPFIILLHMPRIVRLSFGNTILLWSIYCCQLM